MLDSFPIAVLVGTVLGVLSGLGIGGGSLLILWLTCVLETSPEQARCINLLFFLPSALVACLFRWKQGNLPFKKISPAIVSGCFAAILFSQISTYFSTGFLRNIFGVFLILVGIRELFYRPRKAK